MKKIGCFSIDPPSLTEFRRCEKYHTTRQSSFLCICCVHFYKKLYKKKIISVVKGIIILFYILELFLPLSRPHVESSYICI